MNNSDQFKVIFSFFTKTGGIGTLIDEGQYSYVKTGDVNGDSYTDMIFGDPHVASALLLYGPNVLSTSFPTFISLAHVPAPFTDTVFNIPAHDIVGTPISPGTVPLDGGAALNALPNMSAGVNFAGNLLGNGAQDVLVEKFSTNYAFDSDLVYVIYSTPGQNFASSVQLLPFGDSRLSHGIVGIDANGLGVHGFTITGPLINGKVAPDSISVKPISDINGDGYDDLIALSNNNTAYIIFGHPEIDKGSSNINLGTHSPYALPILNLPNVASSTFVPSIDDIQSGYLNNDGLGSLLFDAAISSSSLLSHQTINYANYLTLINNGSTDLAAVLSGVFLTNSSLSSSGTPFGSVYAFTHPVTGVVDTSHIVMGLNNQSVLTGTTGIDDIIGGNTFNQTLIESHNGTTDPNLPGIVGSTLIGGSGNTTFVVADSVFHEVRGGSGFNTLTLNSGSLDLTQVPNPSAPTLAQQADHEVVNIEKIILGNQASLTLNTSDVLNDNSNFQKILNPPGSVSGNLLVAAPNSTGTSLNLVNDPQHTWARVGGAGPPGPQIDGHSTSTFESFVNGSTGIAAKVVVESNVAVHIH